jgi:signal transduction histidine kinase
MWLGFWKGGIGYLRDGQIRESYSTADGLGRGLVGGLEVDHDGALWAATGGGLSRVENGRIATLTSKNGLPCDIVHWAIEDDDHFWWLYMPCGLVRLARTELDAWIAAPHHIVHKMVFDGSDGVRLLSQRRSGNSPQVTKATDGRLWFVSAGGVSVLDPRHIPVNKLPPPVNVEQIISDHEVRWQNSWGVAAANLRLPALSRDVQIDYTALSLVAPEKVRFKYKLEGYDSDWQSAGNRRQAFYSALPPHRYRFRVIASNNSGLWNEAGDTLEFSIEPAYYQTRWFAALIAATALLAAWGLYRLRLYQLSREFNVGLEERVTERTRIARELHDTLLQSFQGLVLRLQVVDDLLPDGKAKEQLDQTLQRADQAIAEGRIAVYDLRSSTTVTNDLAQAVRTVGEQLRSQDSAAFRLEVEGSARDLHPIIRDECYRIAHEALRNAFRHAQASQIEVEVRYSKRLLSLRVRDDGVGVPPEVLQGGRPGNYGLIGMRERAKQIGGELNIWSRSGAGTEIELSIAGSIAYRIAVLIGNQTAMELLADACNGREAIDMFRKYRPDVTLMDLQMPEISGIDAMGRKIGQLSEDLLLVNELFQQIVNPLEIRHAGARRHHSQRTRNAQPPAPPCLRTPRF